MVPQGRSDADAELVLSEEQLLVDTQRVPAERVRLRKEVVEEEVTLTVTLRREELVIERLPAEPGAVVEPAADPLGEGRSIELVLFAEEPVVSTRTVPAEVVRLRRDVTTEDRAVTAELRRERVALNTTEEEPDHERP